MSKFVEAYLMAFRMSDCCAWTAWRVCFTRGTPDRFVCARCGKECDVVEDPR